MVCTYCCHQEINSTSAGRQRSCTQNFYRQHALIPFSCYQGVEECLLCCPGDIRSGGLAVAVTISFAGVRCGLASIFGWLMFQWEGKHLCAVDHSSSLNVSWSLYLLTNILFGWRL
jgi:hypothetical protein